MPATVFSAHEVLDLSAVSVSHRRQDEVAVVGRVEGDLGDSRKILSDLVAIFSRLRSEFVEVDLLIEAQILLRPLSLARVARVVEAGSVSIPGDASPRGPSIDSRNSITGFFAAGHVVDVNRSLFTSAAGEGNSNQAPIERGDKKINRRLPIGAQRRWIKEYSFRLPVVDRIQCDEK